MDVKRRRAGLIVLSTVAAAIAAAVVIAHNFQDVRIALARISFSDLALLVTLHWLALIARTEAWWICLSTSKAVLSRQKLHCASGLRFFADTLVPTYIGAWVRIGMIKRLNGQRPPTVGQMISADGVLFLVEGMITVAFLAVASVTSGLAWYWPVGFFVASSLGLGLVFLLRRRWQSRAFVRTFDVLLHTKNRLILTVLLVVVLALQPVRFWIAMDSVGLGPSILTAITAFVSTSIVGALPVGPGPASLGGITAAAGGHDIGEAAAAAVALAGTAFVAAGLYSIAGLAALFFERRRGSVT